MEKIIIGHVDARNTEKTDWMQPLRIEVISTKRHGEFRVQMGAAELTPNECMTLARHLAAAATKAGNLNIFGGIAQ